MSDARGPTAARYAAALAEHLAAGGGEAGLHRAYELGRGALLDGLGVLDLAAMHHEALAGLLAAAPPSSAPGAARAPGLRARLLRGAGAFLAEGLAPFEMAHRSFRESLETLKLRAAELSRLNGRLSAEVAERRRAEEGLRERGLVLENAVEGISRLDAEGRFLSANKAFADLFRYRSGELEGRPWSLVLHPADRERLDGALRSLGHCGRAAPGAAEGRAELEGRGLRKDGSAVSAAVLLLRAPGRSGGCYCFMRDITERKRAEAERARRLAECARADALARSNAELQDFSRILAHDLKEPLRMIGAQTLLLQQRLKGRLGRRAARCAAYAARGAERLSRLIDGLQACTRVDSQGRAFEPVPLSECLEGALGNLRLAVEEAGAGVEADALPVVSGDAVQLTLLLQNLLGNALKFRGSRPPRIRVRARRKNGEWAVSVRDNGRGFDLREFPRLFMLFQRLHPDVPGQGVGLALCKKIVERHGGRLGAVSAPGRGATFFFTLPAVPSPRLGPAARRPAPRALPLPPAPRAHPLPPASSGAR